MAAMLRVTVAWGLLCGFGIGISTATAADPDEVFSGEVQSTFEPIVLTSATDTVVSPANNAEPSTYGVFDPNGGVAPDEVFDGVGSFNLGQATRTFFLGNGNESSWCVTVGAIFLHRSTPRSSVIVGPSPSGTPGSIINGSDYKFGWDAGPELIVQKKTRSGLIFEGRYFDDQNSSASTDQITLSTFRIAGIGVTILGSGPVGSTYTSSLTSTEFNVHAPIVPACTVLAGFRYIDFHDNLHVTIANPGIITNWADTNQLWGAQTGLSTNFANPGSRLQVNGTAKVGAYTNLADNKLTSSIVSGAMRNASNTAYVGEVNFSASYQVTRHLSLRGGYMAMWLDRVALASDAAGSTTQIAGGSSSPIVLGGVLYQGASAGLEVIW